MRFCHSCDMENKTSRFDDVHYVRLPIYLFHQRLFHQHRTHTCNTSGARKYRASYHNVGIGTVIEDETTSVSICDWEQKSKCE